MLNCGFHFQKIPKSVKIQIFARKGLSQHFQKARRRRRSVLKNPPPCKKRKKKPGLSIAPTPDPFADVY